MRILPLDRLPYFSVPWLARLLYRALADSLNVGGGYWQMIREAQPVGKSVKNKYLTGSSWIFGWHHISKAAFETILHILCYQ